MKYNTYTTDTKIVHQLVLDLDDIIKLLKYSEYKNLEIRNIVTTKYNQKYFITWEESL